MSGAQSCVWQSCILAPAGLYFEEWFAAYMHQALMNQTSRLCTQLHLKANAYFKRHASWLRAVGIESGMDCEISPDRISWMGTGDAPPMLVLKVLWSRQLQEECTAAAEGESDPWGTGKWAGNHKDIGKHI